MANNTYNPADPIDQARINFFLETGQVFACATESVWGLTCDADNQQAVARLRAMKNRPEDKGLILVTGVQQQLDFLFDSLPQSTIETINNYWPGYCTLLIPDPLSRIPPWIKGNSDKVAIRLSQHTSLCQLSNLWQGLLVSSSANPAGQDPARKITELQEYFSQDLPIITSTLGGQATVSPIIDVQTGQTIR